MFPGEQSEFHGFTQYDFELNFGSCKVVVPRQEADGKPWVWRARFFGHEPQFDIAMLERGYHIATCDVAGLFGSPQAVARWEAFYEYLRFEHLFADRVVLEGMSRGGLIIYNWAALHPDKVVCLYGDNPVCDFKSWPAGRGAGPGEAESWAQCLKAYNLSEAEALAWQGNPVDNLAPLAAADVPILHIIGEADETVPVAENSDLLEARYRELGGSIEVIRKPGAGHHPHSLEDPTPIVEFVLRHAKGNLSVRPEELVGDHHITVRGELQNTRLVCEQTKRCHVAFLGGSITQMDGYRPKVCRMLTQRFPETDFTFTAAGISSTCSDTGAFRLRRDVLSQGALDLLVVEFAVNDDQDAQQGYEDALRGMEGIVAQARAHNPSVDIVMIMFVNERMLAQLQVGETPRSIAAHERVAVHYGVTVVNLAAEVAALISADKMDWAMYGGVHPADFGNTLCATMIRRALLPRWEQALPPDAAPAPYPEVTPLDEKSYVRGRLLSVDQVAADAQWEIGVPDWDAENDGAVRERFLGVPFLVGRTAGARLRVPFRGTAIGAYILAGPDAAILRCTVDGESREIDTLHHYSRFNYPMTLMFFTELAAGEHELELEILPNRPGRLHEGGTAFRAIAFTAN